MTATWTDAIREYAKQTGKWMVPKKDSAEYKAVKAIQEKLKNPPPVETPQKKRGRPTKATTEVKEAVAEPVAPIKSTKKVATEAPAMPPTEEKQKKPRAKKAVVEEPVQQENEAIAPVKEKKTRAIRTPKVSIENKKVILNFD